MLAYAPFSSPSKNITHTRLHLFWRTHIFLHPPTISSTLGCNYVGVRTFVFTLQQYHPHLTVTMLAYAPFSSPSNNIIHTRLLLCWRTHLFLHPTTISSTLECNYVGVRTFFFTLQQYHPHPTVIMLAYALFSSPSNNILHTRL